MFKLGSIRMNVYISSTVLNPPSCLKSTFEISTFPLVVFLL